MHSKQALSPVHEICRLLWIPKAKKLFVRASSSEVRARHLCRRFQREIVRTKAFPRYRHFPNLNVCDSRPSPTSASLLSLFRGNDVKAFETAAIEDDAGDQDGKRWRTFRTEYYAKGWPQGGMAICATCRSLLLRKSRLKSCSLYKCLHLQCLINTRPL